MILSGCGGGSDRVIDRQPVQGEVTLDGEPLDQGTVRFEPFADVKDRTASGGPVVKGRYELPKAAGLPPGKYMVSITSSEAVALPANATADELMAAGANMKPKPERIPAKYNQQTELVIDIKSGTNTHDFPLKTQKK